MIALVNAVSQLVLRAFVQPVVISQLISGALSDRFGRKKFLFGGLVVFIVGGIGALLSTTIDVLIGFWRLQGVCHCECDDLQHSRRGKQ